ncbi:MAG TPA: L-histidine N(alpha)-methyltransferase [Verrucomicrobiae bacterium]
MNLSSSVSVAIHPGQFPENVRRDLLESLRTRRVNHKFHYDSVKQTQKWLALHEAHSPARRDKNCLTTYNEAFIATVKKIKSKSVHVIGLGCGGGQKDVQLLKQLQSSGKKNSYAPGDVSVAMVLVAREAALKILPEKNCFPFVCDLATARNLAETVPQVGSSQGARLVTFFGMIPNFEPRQILPKLAELLCPNDFLLFSTNLAPGTNYVAGIKKILPQYDNPLTRDWLLTFLFDLGIEPRDGELRFSIETGGLGLQRVVAKFHFRRARKIKVSGEEFSFARGESIQLFFSYRYTPARVRKILARYGLEVREEWISNSGEEGVFLCRRK